MLPLGGGALNSHHVNHSNLNHSNTITINSNTLHNNEAVTTINVRSRCGSLFDIENFYKDSHFDDSISVVGANNSLTKTPLYG
jgi:hypothetical protein